MLEDFIDDLIEAPQQAAQLIEDFMRTNEWYANNTPLINDLESGMNPGMAFPKELLRFTQEHTLG